MGALSRAHPRRDPDRVAARRGWIAPNVRISTG
jgi:hypothetical protein